MTSWSRLKSSSSSTNHYYLKYVNYFFVIFAIVMMKCTGSEKKKKNSEHDFWFNDDHRGQSIGGQDSNRVRWTKPRHWHCPKGHFGPEKAQASPKEREVLGKSQHASSSRKGASAPAPTPASTENPVSKAFTLLFIYLFFVHILLFLCRIQDLKTLEVLDPESRGATSRDY